MTCGWGDAIAASAGRTRGAPRALRRRPAGVPIPEGFLSLHIGSDDLGIAAGTAIAEIGHTNFAVVPAALP